MAHKPGIFKNEVIDFHIDESYHLFLYADQLLLRNSVKYDEETRSYFDFMDYPDLHLERIQLDCIWSLSDRARLNGFRWIINNFVNEANHRAEGVNRSLASLISKGRDFSNLD